MKGSPQLFITYPDAKQCLIDVRGNATIGRDSGNTIVLDEISISRCHAVLLNQQEGVVLVDLDSTNGTYVNNSMTSPDEPVLLTDGDIITLGRVTLRYSLAPANHLTESFV